MPEDTNSVTAQIPATPTLYPPTRKWMLHPSANTNVQDLVLHVSSKIRGESPKQIIADKLYSSHRYVIQMDATGACIGGNNVVMAKLSIVEPLNHDEQVLKNGKVIVKGTTECSMTMQPKKHGMSGSLKIQFTDVSYHNDRKYFAIKIQFVDANDAVLFAVISPPFRVYARKPSEKDNTNTTTATTTTNDEELPATTAVVVTSKKRKQQHEDNDNAKKAFTYEMYKKKLQELVALKSTLSEQEQKLAHEFALEQLMAQSVQQQQQQQQLGMLSFMLDIWLNNNI